MICMDTTLSDTLYSNFMQYIVYPILSFAMITWKSTSMHWSKPKTMIISINGNNKKIYNGFGANKTIQINWYFHFLKTLSQ